MTTHHTVGIDIGGTSIRAAVVDERGEILDTVRAQTPATAPALEKCLDRLVFDLASRWSVSAVGLAIAGFLTPDCSRVRFSPHLPWREAAVAADMTARIGLPVACEHDANAAAIAERRFGAAAGGRNVVVLAIGTGIGAGLLLDGEIYRGSHGVAPELGHLRVVPSGRLCACGKNGCFERYCSGTALVDNVVELVADGKYPFSQIAREIADDPGSLTGRRVAAGAHDGDPVGLAAFADFAQWLGLGLAMIGDIFDPDLIVLAGGVGASSGLFLDEAREHYGALLTGSGHRRLARIRGTQLGEAAGMIGAAAIARSRVVQVSAS
ncbi:ROK family protein [Williamsia sp. CHRR-6]|uniref:ROK family protein n=1 Tax=Williamsia sp. CHRR-6 TaxID=2835871 RepID=UPI001BDAAF21|nr:ROK family protein [Williamsia sp. CHRR-6]MBT0565288.1 ROK family protein [Williamsia sp. CHRR-6]